MDKCAIKALIYIRPPPSMAHFGLRHYCAIKPDPMAQTKNISISAGFHKV